MVDRGVGGDVHETRKGQRSVSRLEIESSKGRGEDVFKTVKPVEKFRVPTEGVDGGKETGHV